MLSKKCIYEYRKQFPNDDCSYGEPSGFILIENEELGIVQESEDETDEIFFDRLDRSKKAGKNLFFEEWETFEYIKGAYY